MKQKILKIVNDIKDHLKDIDDDGVYHSRLDDIYDSLSLIEDELYAEDDVDVNDLGLDDDF
jgi:hypothetical protein